MISSLEREIVEDILWWADNHPYVTLFTNVVTPSVLGPSGLGAGSPDLVGWVLRRVGGEVVPHFLALEVKTEKGKPTALQLEWLEHASAAGVICGIVRSVEDVEALVNPYIGGRE